MLQVLHKPGPESSLDLTFAPSINTAHLQFPEQESAMTDVVAQRHDTQAQPGPSQPFVSKWASRYRGATVEDLDPPPALSLNPSDSISVALLSAFERDYTHLTIVDSSTRALLGYISIPRLQALLQEGRVQPEDEVGKAMLRFRRKGRAYRVITMDTPLEELEAFFEGAMTDGQKQDFAVITDAQRRFVLGVATREDLEEFVKRRPA
ncbi:hypothetical protein VTJ04DRAFT_3576 [Mycothermus thermophilus]|uniref:uncharacterized protein n=1 Tax=Humicola insolens TaxID=85995 RepID=UPI0037424EB4